MASSEALGRFPLSTDKKSAKREPSTTDNHQLHPKCNGLEEAWAGNMKWKTHGKQKTIHNVYIILNNFLLTITPVITTVKAKGTALF